MATLIGKSFAFWATRIPILTAFTKHDFTVRALVNFNFPFIAKAILTHGIRGFHENSMTLINPLQEGTSIFRAIFSSMNEQNSNFFLEKLKQILKSAEENKAMMRHVSCDSLLNKAILLKVG